MFRYTILVFLGGGIGACARFLFSEFVFIISKETFPLNTLIVNVIGCLLMGYISVYLTLRFETADGLRSFILIGILGGFTTFSTFSLETLNLFTTGRPLAAGFYIISSFTLCILAVVIGSYVSYKFF